jgi:DnaJ-class molecular chaperone
MSSVPPSKRLLVGIGPGSSPPPPSVSESLPPDDLEPDGDDLVLRWDENLDAADYFTLLRLDVPQTPEQTVDDARVRDAFHAFALAFHPDRYRGADDVVREAANRVYCRGAEGYRVLLDPTLRRHYVQLMREGTLRMSAEDVAESVKGAAATTIESLVKSATARPFAKRADELIALGDLKQARLQLRLALMKEPQNARLEERMRDLEVKITERPK